VIRAFIERLLLPGLGYCYRCRRPWKTHGIGVVEHATNYTETSGMFPLCEGCWSKLSPEERLPYYRKLWDSWNHGGFWIQYADGTWHEWEAPEPWPVIEKAVLAEASNQEGES